MDGFISLLTDYPVLEGFWMNIQLAFYAGIASFLLGVILALFRISPVRSLNWIGTTYVNVILNTPLTVIVVMGTLVLWGQLHISFSSDFETNFFIIAIICLAIYHSTIFCEAIRSGVNTVPVGQAEASRSIGLGFFRAAWHVILPQAVRGAIVPLGNALIFLTKNTTLAAAASVMEASGVMRTMIEFNPDLMIYIFLTIAIGFCFIVMPIGFITTWLSNRLAVNK